jgi:hypothetical protein
VPSSPIASACFNDVDDSLLGVLGKVPDPRDPRGVRYPLPGMLAVAVCAVVAGARSFTAIGEWAVDLSAEHLHRLGLARAPEESTMRKVFARVDAAALDRQLAVVAWTRTRHIQGARVIAIDGKTGGCQVVCVSEVGHMGLQVGVDAVGVDEGEFAEGGFPALDDGAFDELAGGLAGAALG